MQPFMKKWTYMHCIVLFFLKLQCLACNLHGVKTGRNILTWFAICRWYAGWSSSRCLQGGVALSQGALDLLTGESRVSHFLDFLIFVKLASLQQSAMPFTPWFLGLWWVKLYLQYTLYTVSFWKTEVYPSVFRAFLPLMNPVWRLRKLHQAVVSRDRASLDLDSELTRRQHDHVS